MHNERWLSNLDSQALAWSRHTHTKTERAESPKQGRVWIWKGAPVDGEMGEVTVKGCAAGGGGRERQGDVRRGRGYCSARGQGQTEAVVKTEWP